MNTVDDNSQMAMRILTPREIRRFIIGPPLNANQPDRVSATNRSGRRHPVSNQNSITASAAATMPQLVLRHRHRFAQSVYPMANKSNYYLSLHRPSLWSY